MTMIKTILSKASALALVVLTAGSLSLDLTAASTALAAELPGTYWAGPMISNGRLESVLNVVNVDAQTSTDTDAAQLITTVEEINGEISPVSAGAAGAGGGFISPEQAESLINKLDAVQQSIEKGDFEETLKLIDEAISVIS